MTDLIIWDWDSFSPDLLDIDGKGGLGGTLYGEIVDGRVRRDFEVIATLKAPYDGRAEFRDEDIINTGGWDIDEV